MKRFFSSLVRTLPRRIAIVAASLVVAFGLPLAVMAQDTVNIQATTGVANLSAGQTTYSGSVSASYNQEVEIQVLYLNPNPPSSNKVADNVHIKINVPSAAGTKQVVTTDTDGTNTNNVTGQATVNLNSANEYLQYIPGSAVARVTNDNGTVNTYDLPDSQGPVTSYNANGYLLDNGDPCNAASVRILARVVESGVSVEKQVELAGQTNAWGRENTADPGDTLDYLITYTNDGNTVENQVKVADSLPPGLTLVSGSTTVYDGAHPSGIVIPDNDITAGGVDLGNFNPGATAYITLKATVPTASKMACGSTIYQNIGEVQPQGMDWYYSNANTTVNNQCKTPTPTYSCDALNVNVTTGSKTITASTQTTAKDGATLTSVTYNFGDGSTPLVSNQPSVSYTYANYGSYIVTATAQFNVNGTEKSVTSSNCSKSITLTPPNTTVTTTTPPTPPAQLANTGPGDVIGIFAATTIAATVGHRLFKSRQFARHNK